MSNVDLKNIDSSQLRTDLISLEFMLKHRVIPLTANNDYLQLVSCEPLPRETITIIEFMTGLQAQIILVSKNHLDNYLNELASSPLIYSQLEKNLSKLLPIEESINITQSDSSDEPVIEFVNHLINDAIANQISDVHIEPYPDRCRIRFRRDGLLYDATRIPTALASSITTRLKILSNLNIAEKRLPQDGRFSFHTKNHADIRINICPTIHGEKIVLRILRGFDVDLSLTSLGLTTSQLKLVQSTLNQPHGLMLVTGPTGSGKTLTLYAALQYLNDTAKNIVTIEDPVEIELDHINQININPKIGLGFPHVLRALLRQDPDIMMIGEIRDTETANIAIQSAHTGHFVLSTLHTQSAHETITRLRMLGINMLQLVSAISLIVTQRLIRKLCHHCKQQRPLPAAIQAQIQLIDAFYPVGCKQCHLGYQGRTGVFECVQYDAHTASIMLSNAGATSSQPLIQSQHNQQLWENGLEYVRNGTTSYTELIRVLGNITT